MALPVLNAPTYELTLTSSGETIRYRPFLVKEEKILLMALESNDEQEMMRSMKQIISSCVMSDIDVEKLPIFDIQYLFLSMRSVSVGEEIVLRFKHPDDLNSNLVVALSLKPNLPLCAFAPDPCLARNATLFPSASNKLNLDPKSVFFAKNDVAVKSPLALILPEAVM